MQHKITNRNMNIIITGYQSAWVISQWLCIPNQCQYQVQSAWYHRRPCTIFGLPSTSQHGSNTSGPVYCCNLEPRQPSTLINNLYSESHMPCDP